MYLTESLTELTTSATDALLGIECLVIMGCLRRVADRDRWRSALWCWVFALMALAAFFGAVVHGLMLSDSIQAVLWKLLSLSLGILVALFMVGAVYDWRGRAVATRLIPWAIGLGCIFFGLTEFAGGAFIVFVVYEATVMVSALAIYLFLAVSRRLKGAAVIATAILLNLVAAALQASDLSLWLFVPFDHNGLFHLVQMLSTAILGLGLAVSMGSGVGGGHPLANKRG